MPSIPLISLRFNASEVQELLSSPSGHSSAIDLCARLGARKAYLECPHEAEAPHDGLDLLQKNLEESGISTAGCIVAVPPETGHPASPAPYCFNDIRNQNELKEIVRRSAQRFEEVLLEGWTATSCECAECRAAKRRRSWADFRRSLLLQMSKELILAPAREARPNVRLSLMLHPEATSGTFELLPHSQFFNCLLLNSYDTATAGNPESVRSQNGNKVSTGEDSPVAAASPDPSLYFRWMTEIAGRKAWGAQIERSPANHEGQVDELLRQSTEMVLAGAKEITFHYSDISRLSERSLSVFQTQLEQLKPLANAAKQTPVRGIAVYLPPRSFAPQEPELLTALRRSGFPLRPTPRFPASSRAALLTAHSLANPDLLPQVGELVEKGGKVAAMEVVREALDKAGVGHDLLGKIIGIPASVAERAFEEGVLPGEYASLESVRNVLLSPMGIQYSGPPGVTLSLFGFTDSVLHNNGSVAARCRMNWEGKRLRIVGSSDSSLEIGEEWGESERELAANGWVLLSSR